jgi:hypothetical protein
MLLYGEEGISETEGDPLTDTTSHLPAASAHSKKGESARHQDDSISHQVEVSLPRATDRHRQDDSPYR